MDRHVLRKVQLMQLEIAREIKRVCEENGIRFFLCCGTLLGAVRHQGFIPWDDDMDVGMLREDYERFCRIAPEKLDKRFCIQSWYTEPNYALPFAKVRMRGTLYREAKGNRLAENGFYVDIFPFDNAPQDQKAQKLHARKLADLFYCKLMKSGCKPWMENDRISWKKRLGYLFFQGKALLKSGETLARQYDALATSLPQSDVLCRQRGLFRLDCYQSAWYSEFTELPFEGELFPVPADYDAVLTAQFGDYMTPPPEDKRENRHQIQELDFGDYSERRDA